MPVTSVVQDPDIQDLALVLNGKNPLPTALDGKFGLRTFKRLVKENNATDEFRRKLKKIKKWHAKQAKKAATKTPAIPL